MRISYKKINTIIFVIAFFLQAYIDGVYIAHDINPIFLKALKYAFFLIGIIWGFICMKDRKITCYVKETFGIMMSICSIFILSLCLMIINGGKLDSSLELTFRFSIAILYAFVILNVYKLDDIYQLMIYVLCISIIGWIWEKGIEIFANTDLNSISFVNSFSPFESSYFAAPSINCCAFFMYYRKNKIISVIAFAFALLTFKRPAIVFSFVVLLLPYFFNVNRQINKYVIFIGKIMCIVATIVWYNLLLSKNEIVFNKLINDSAVHFTQGRSRIFNNVLETGYKAAGLGSTNNIVGRGIEMDLIQFYLETTIVGLTIIVFAYVSAAGKNFYALLLMGFHMFGCLTGSGLYNSFGWVPVFVTLGCINYKDSEEFQVEFPLLKRYKKR